jgi:hypothetical protein
LIGACSRATLWLLASIYIAFTTSCTTSVRTGHLGQFAGPNAEKLLVPILDAHYAAQTGSPDSAARNLEVSNSLLDQLLQDRSTAADEALVILLGFSLGEGNDHEVERNLTMRGTRILSLLRRYRYKPVVFAGKEYLDSLRLPSDDRKKRFHHVRESIE